MLIVTDNDVLGIYAKASMLVKLSYIENGLVINSSENGAIDTALASLSLQEQIATKRKYRKILRKSVKNKSKLKKLSKSKRRAIVYNKLYISVIGKYEINDNRHIYI